MHVSGLCPLCNCCHIHSVKIFETFASQGTDTLRETMAYLRRLPPCLITWWFVAFSGKDTSCYCPNPGFENFRVHETQDTHTHTHTYMQKAPEEAASSLPDLSFSSEQGRTVFLSSLPNPSVSATLNWSLPSTHNIIELSWNAPYYAVFLPLAARLTSALLSA